MRALTSEPRRAADWAAAAKDAESVDWDRVFAGYESSVGSPGTAFWREIVDAFPAAKVVLTVRDPEKWYDSAARTVSASIAPQPLLVRLLSWRGPRGHSAEDEVLEEVQRLTWEKEVGGRFADRDHSLASFEEHIANVRAHVPADRLLVFDVREGWAPLCAFLGVPEPADPFPRENDTATFQRRQRDALTRALVPRAIAVTAIGTVVALTAWVVRRRRPPS